MPWYFMMDLFILILAITVFIWAWKKLDHLWKIGTIICSVVVMALQTWNQIWSYNTFNAWDFSSKHNTFVGIDFLNSPLEEYLFWYGFAIFVIYLYAGLNQRFNTKPAEVSK